jgi:pimeloyl-ACP methyl ester carboxylesterase
VALLALGTSCGGDGPRAFPPDTPLQQQCPSSAAGAKRVVVTAADGFRMGAALTGPTTSHAGVVISYGQGQIICDWLDIAAGLTRDTGAQVLVLERRGRGSSPGKRNLLLGPSDVAAAANYLYSHGVQRLVVIGSSLGTLFAFIGSSPSGPQDAVRPADTSPAMSSPPCGVVLVSPLLDWRADGGELRNLDVRTLRSRLWLVYEKGNGTIAADAARMASHASEIGVQPQQVVGVDTKDHGRRLVSEHAEARSVLDSAVRACA